MTTLTVFLQSRTSSLRFSKHLPTNPSTLRHETGEKNLLFRGIKETRYENCSVLVMEFLAHTLQINTTGTVITRVHRLGPTKVGQTFSRPIIVNYTNYNNVPLIMSNAKTGYSIDRDMSKEIVDARKRLWGKVKVTKKENPGSSVRKTELPRTNSRTGMLL